MLEKRKFKRLVTKEKTSLQSKEGKEEGLLVDISPGGMRIFLDRHIGVGTLISGQFRILPNSGPFYVTGEVVWSKGKEVGIKFSRVTTIPFQ